MAPTRQGKKRKTNIPILDSTPDALPGMKERTERPVGDGDRRASLTRGSRDHRRRENRGEKKFGSGSVADQNNGDKPIDSRRRGTSQ